VPVLLDPAENWFANHGWSAFPFQKQVWTSYLEGKSGLVHSSTGTGKTYAVWFGPILEWLHETEHAPGIRVLWITPLRALVADTLASIQLPIDELNVPWTVEARTGDTSSSVRARQREKLPTALVTTPENLSLFFSRPGSEELFAGLRMIVCDEWHELMSTKRGIQAELCLARLRRICPSVRTWGVSATLGNLDEAMDTLLGSRFNQEDAVLVQGTAEKLVVIDTLLPQNISRFPWAGHFGAQMLQPVIRAIEESGTCLLFTNTRSHAELWYQDLLKARPDWADQIGLHHGSLSREVRDDVEFGLKTGRLRAVVCTSSLDLGVDFSPVDRVLQLGSPKSVARLLQRAGRSGHQPGAPSRITCVPTHAFELVDMSAAREAVRQGKIERRSGITKPLDVLAQHLITIAAGSGFEAHPMLDEVRSSDAYRTLSDEEWEWVLGFVTTGGDSLKAYPEYQRVVEQDGVYRVRNEDVAKRHRLSIGTIVSDAAMNVRYVGGGHIGTIEESFIARLSPGDTFLFGGKALKFVRVQDLTAFVNKAIRVSGAVPRWMGGRLPLSGELSNAIRHELDKARNGELDSPEMQALQPILELQARWSAIPGADELLIERLHDAEGFHIFFYPFEGRLVHEGLAALFAYRIAQHAPITFSMAMNDYGFELLATEPAPLDTALVNGLLDNERLGEEILLSLNSVEMAKRQFREVARVAGLIFQGYPGAHKSSRQLQSSSGLFYDVFARFDPGNMLLHQSQREVLERQLEESRMSAALERLSRSRLVIAEPERPTPLSFPILVDRLRQTLTTESLPVRIQKLAAQLESAASDGRSGFLQ
jgi:ATP-dependent Lhr-like helicase